MDLSNGSLRRLAIAIMTKEFEIIEIEVKEGVALDSGIKDIMLPNVILLGGGWRNSLSFNVVTTLVDSTWAICQ